MQEVIDTHFTENNIQLIQSGTPYFNLLIKLINEANYSIQLQTYIFSDDRTGGIIIDALKAAQRRKVIIHILVDGYASRDLSKEFVTNLQKAGIYFRFFTPLFKNKNFYFGRRLHHKMMVVDAKYAVVGGMNIADRYNDLPEKKAWLDYAVLAEGPIAKELCILCWKTWNGYVANMPLIECEEKSIEFVLQKHQAVSCRPRRNDWVRNKNEISTTYREIFKQTEKQITILCSYFLPGSTIRKLIRNAKAKGVRIRVILAGQSDEKIGKAAERWMYDWLLRMNIELYEYQPNVLHAKLCVADESFVTIGSYNINNISAYASIELNIDIKDAKFAKEVTLILDNIIKNECIHITDAVYRKTNNIFKQLYHWCCYKFFRMIFFLFTFYFKQKE